MSLALTLIDVDNHDWDISARGVSVKGNAYWVAKKNDNEFFQFILSFDFTRERFGLLPLPYESDGYDYFMTDKYANTAVLSVGRDEQLSVWRWISTRSVKETKVTPIAKRVLGNESETIPKAYRSTPAVALNVIN